MGKRECNWSQEKRWGSTWVGKGPTWVHMQSPANYGRVVSGMHLVAADACMAGTKAHVVECAAQRLDWLRTCPGGVTPAVRAPLAAPVTGTPSTCCSLQTVASRHVHARVHARVQAPARAHTHVLCMVGYFHVRKMRERKLLGSRCPCGWGHSGICVDEKTACRSELGMADFVLW